MIFSDILFDLARRNLQLHSLRSLLAVIGIVIGVLAITSMGILGASLQASVTDQFSDSVNILTVSSDSRGGYDKITDRQLKEITTAAGQSNVFALNTEYDRITVGSEMGFVGITALKPEYMSDLLELSSGRFPKAAEGVAVGQTLADEYDLKVGSRITIGKDDKEKRVRVLGILKNTGFGGVISTDYSIISSERWYFSVYGDTKEYDQVAVQVRDMDDIDSVKESIETHLNRNRKKVVTIMDSRDFLQAVNGVLGTISLFIMAIGGISLLVAGVSIFNVMLMSVNERVKEIGILRSIGTQKQEIRMMFLYEALILGFTGSIVGGLLSFLGGGAIVYLMLNDLSCLFAPSTMVYVLYGVIIGTTVSVLSGVYPAYKAAELNPIDALSAE